MRRLLANTVLRIDYTIVSTAFTGADTLTTFLQSASTLSQLTTALQSSYAGVTVAVPTVTTTTSVSSSSSSSSSSSIAIIAGAAGGGGGLLLFCCLGCLLYYRARKATAKKDRVHMDASLPSQPQQHKQQPQSASPSRQPQSQIATDDARKVVSDNTSMHHGHSDATVSTGARKASGGGPATVPTVVANVMDVSPQPVDPAAAKARGAAKVKENKAAPSAPAAALVGQRLPPIAATAGGPLQSNDVHHDRGVQMNQMQAAAQQQLAAAGGEQSTPPVQMPPGWVVQTDPTSGTPFFVYTPTGHTQWTPPVSAADGGGPVPVPTPSAAPAGQRLPPIAATAGGPLQSNEAVFDAHHDRGVQMNQTQPAAQQHPSAPPAQMPPGWIAQTDPTSGAPFFVYTPTGHTQWTPPV